MSAATPVERNPGIPEAVSEACLRQKNEGRGRMTYLKNFWDMIAAMKSLIYNKHGL
jgi:hypothetical protein